MFEWWHWMVLGLCLSMFELAVPAFFIIWFGIGAMGVSLVLLLVPEMSIAAQMLIWAAVSTALVIFWSRYRKPRTVPTAGTSAANVIGEVGVLVSDLCPDTRGKT